MPWCGLKPLVGAIRIPPLPGSELNMENRRPPRAGQPLRGTGTERERKQITGGVAAFGLAPGTWDVL